MRVGEGWEMVGEDDKGQVERRRMGMGMGE